MRTTFTRTCLLAILIGAAPAAAQVPDIRGLTFDLSLGLELHGNVLESHFHGIQPLTALDPVPWTFDILPDPDAPKDPARILLRTRLPTGVDTPDPMRFELLGSYDAETGAIEASGVSWGCHDWKTPFQDDAFGLLDAPADVWLMLRDPVMSLQVVVVVPTETEAACILAFDIAGGTVIQPMTAAADLELNAQLIAWLPGGQTDLAEANFGPYACTEVTCSLTALSAHLREVFGDMNDDALLTQMDVIEIHKLFGVVDVQGPMKGDLTADGVVDEQDADYLQWLVRCIGNKDVFAGGSHGMQGTAGKTGVKQVSSKP
ncbi:MAG TPA: hypothetical protein VFY71_16050 [Planctomycetota bacterium]|nr:hypothetical protein [Planctomycetota bacterium]